MIFAMEADERIAKLTEREKICLRLWLQHKSAKEIAADLQITHHAVEKRLKIARMKLGATSSLQAARLLDSVESYGSTVAQSSDLVLPPPTPQSKVDPKLIIGGIVMSLIAAVALVFAMQPSAQEAHLAEVDAVVRERDEQLNILLDALISSADIDPDGEVILIWAFQDRRFLEPNSGYYWQISAEGREDFTSRSLWDRALKPSGQSALEPFHYDSNQFANEPLRVVEQTVVLAGSDVRWRFMVARPRE
jgi:DNA-binding CsgD family transcriptional regulator